MSKRAKTVILFIIIAIFCGFILPFLSISVEMHAGAETVAAPLSYTYTTYAPLAVAADGDKLYALDRFGGVLDVGRGMAVAAARPGATKLAAGGGKIATDTEEHCVAVFCGNFVAEMTPDAIYVGEGERRVVAVRPDEGYSFVAGALDGNTLYAAADNGSRTSLFAYDLAQDNKKTLIEYETGKGDDRDVTAVSVLDDGVIYYATPYSLYTLGKSSAEHIGGITSLTSDGTNLFFTTVTGEICRYDGVSTTTIIAAAEKVAVATRKNFAVFTDKGNNRLTLLRDGATRTATVEQPVSAAIDYAGNIYAAGGNKVKMFTRSLEYVGEDADMVFGDANETIAEIKIDPADVTGCTLYALSETGTLRRSTDDRTAHGIAHAEIAADGAIYAMKTDGSVVTLSDDLATETAVSGVGEYVDFALDRAGHLYRAARGGIYRDEESTPVFAADGITDIAIANVTLGDSGKAVSYGDLIVITESGSANVVVPRAQANTDMRDDDTDEEYTAFLAAANDASPNAADRTPEIRKAETVSDVYLFPSESPVGGNREIDVGSSVIILAPYKDSAYSYAIAETSTGSVKGFVNVGTLSDPLPLDKVYDSDFCLPLKTASIYKIPSQIAPVVGTTALGTKYALLPFASVYRDWAGREWCRISFGADAAYEGYVLRTNVSVNGRTGGGQNRDLYTDAVIKADTEIVKTYIDDRGEYELGTVADGTPVKLEESFNKSREYTKITFVGDTATGETTTCYVRTEFIKHTEAGSYQVIFFIVAGVLIVAIAVIIIVRVGKKRRID